MGEKLILKEELQNYLVDPEHKIIDKGTKDVTKALYNIIDNDKFAEVRKRNNFCSKIKTMLIIRDLTF